MYLGDTFAILPMLDPVSVDSIVTDPRYGLQFCNQSWDGASGFREPLADVDTAGLSDAEVLEAWCRAWAGGRRVACAEAGRTPGSVRRNEDVASDGSRCGACWV
ncbi:MAG: hypothetical protein FWD74_03985 [Actinomycetia bacterium]|nr:hypothetical protein [Actinomycetes bacterium]